MKRITNRQTGKYVEELKEFKANNINAEVKTAVSLNDFYVVYSYGYYPIFVFFKNTWFENMDTYSKTTAKHITQCRPQNVKIRKLPKRVIKKLVSTPVHTFKYSLHNLGLEKERPYIKALKEFKLNR